MSIQDDQLLTLKHQVLSKLTRKLRLSPIGLDVEYKTLHNLVEQTVTSGEGNSLLVIGARGSGKTNLVENAISEVRRKHGEDFHTIRLNGFIQSDDKLALKEIWRQLGRDLDADEDNMKTTNFADVLSSLLALLSHPSELSLDASDRASKSVIIILDEFDLFATHPRQTLLYNLFDIAQARKAPLGVIGLTTKVNVAESLEKRVKSRFSHRYIHLPLSKTLQAFWDVCKQGLLIESQQAQEGSPNANESSISAWNAHVEGLWENDETFRKVVQSIYYKSKSVTEFFTACLVPVASFNGDLSSFSGQTLAQNLLAAPDSKLSLLEGLSELELSLLIAAARLDIVLDTDMCNFNMAYEEYTTVASRVKVQSSASGAAAVGAGSKISGPEVSLAAWEKLTEYGLIVPAIGAVATAGGATGYGGGSGSKDVDRRGRMFRVDVGLDEILPTLPNMSAAMAKWCSSI